MRHGGRGKERERKMVTFSTIHTTHLLLSGQNFRGRLQSTSSFFSLFDLSVTNQTSSINFYQISEQNVLIKIHLFRDKKIEIELKNREGLQYISYRVIYSFARF